MQKYLDRYSLDVVMDYFIQKKLESLGITVVGYSEHAQLLQTFLTEQSDQLFSFLIENTLNRYLFNVILRLGSLDIDNLPFSLNELNPERIRQSVSESFIKKYECPTCKHLLIRKHSYEIPYRKILTRECPICNTSRTFSFRDFVDEFTITRNDLHKYLERLVSISVVRKQAKYLCRNCKKYEPFSDNLKPKCPECGDLRGLLPVYTFQSEFLQQALERQDGSWFEWYVFMIAREIHDSADNNIIISFEESGFVKETEIDVISIDKKENLHIFECKDHLRKDSKFGDMERLPFLSQLFSNIYFASSQKIDKSSARSIQELCKRPVQFIEGKDLEQQFINLDNVLKMFLEGHCDKAARLCSKLAEYKRGQIAEILLSKLLESKGHDQSVIRGISALLWNHCIDLELLKIETERFKQAIQICISNIEQNESVNYSLDIIVAIFREYSKEMVLEIIDFNGLFKLGIPYLTKESLVGYEQRRQFYSFYKEIFRTTNIDTSKLDKNAMEMFLLKFVPMFGIYYNWYNRALTLKGIDVLWNFRNKESVDQFVETIQEVLLKPPAAYDPADLLNFVVDKYETFDVGARKRLNEIFEKYLESGKYAEKVRIALSKLKAK